MIKVMNCSLAVTQQKTKWMRGRNHSAEITDCITLTSCPTAMAGYPPVGIAARLIYEGGIQPVGLLSSAVKLWLKPAAGGAKAAIC